MVTNKDLQQEFEKFLNGEKIEWQLLKVFFHQNGGFSRITADKERALGMTVKENQKITVSFMEITEEDGTLYAEEKEPIALEIDEKLKHKMIQMVKTAEGKQALNPVTDPNNQDDMYK